MLHRLGKNQLKEHVMRLFALFICLMSCFTSAIAITGVQYYQDTLIANTSGTPIDHQSPAAYAQRAQQYTGAAQKVSTGRIFRATGSSQELANRNAMSQCENRGGTPDCRQVRLHNGQILRPNTYIQQKPKTIKYRTPVYKESTYHSNRYYQSRPANRRNQR